VDSEAASARTPVKTLEPAEATQPSVPPRASVTVAAVSAPDTEVVPEGPAVRTGVPATVARARLPPVRVKVASLVAADAGRAKPPTKAAAVRAVVRGMRIFIGRAPRRCRRHGRSAAVRCESIDGRNSFP
jgi:hypothetical protein